MGATADSPRKKNFFPDSNSICFILHLTPIIGVPCSSGNLAFSGIGFWQGRFELGESAGVKADSSVVDTSEGPAVAWDQCFHGHDEAASYTTGRGRRNEGF